MSNATSKPARSRNRTVANMPLNETDTAHLPAPIQAPAPAPVPAPVIAGPMRLLEAAVARGASVEELDRLIQLKERMEADEARKAFVAAMAEFKRNPPRIEKTRTADVKAKNEGGHSFAYKYANLADVCEQIVARLAECGISHDWSTRQDAGLVQVTCTLTHELGHSKSTSLSSGTDQTGGKNALQALGSAVSYLERYTLLAACGIAVDDAQDDDGGPITADEREELRGAARDMRRQHKPADVAARYERQQAPDGKLLSDARAAANHGRDAFGEFWRGLKGSERNALADELPDLHARTTAAHDQQKGIA